MMDSVNGVVYSVLTSTAKLIEYNKVIDDDAFEHNAVVILIFLSNQLLPQYLSIVVIMLLLLLVNPQLPFVTLVLHQLVPQL